MSQSPNNAAAPPQRHNPLRSLRSRNYRLFFFGQGTSLVGTWLTTTAIAWLVNTRTDSNALLLGLVGFASQVPAFFLAPFAGAWIDRTNLRRLLIITQSLSMLESFALAGLAWSHVIEVWQVLALCVFQGLINGFDMPGRQSFMIEMVESRDDLSNAIALNSSMVNGARMLGPAIAGLLIYSVGTGWCFLLDGASYLAVIASLLCMRLQPRVAAKQYPNMLKSMREGFAYAFGSPAIRAFLLLFAVVNLTGTPYRVLMPIFAEKIYHGGSPTFGFLMAATGVGALLGAVYLATRTSVLGLGRIIGFATLLTGGGLVAFGMSRWLWLGVPLLFVTGMGLMVQMAAVNTILQTVVDDDKRGRVMSFYTMAFMGTMPLGSLIAGWLAKWIGTPLTVELGGACCVVAGTVFLARLPHLRQFIRPIYIRKGILPEVTPAAEVASG